MKTLVLAEKPSVARDIARVLNCRIRGDGYLEGSRYIVTWALGHLVTLAEPDAYDKRYKSWSIEDLPIIPSTTKLMVIKPSSKQFNIVKTQMNRQDVGEIVLATDAGREGELVGRWIIEKGRINKPLKRLWISSVTDKAIKEGFNRLKDGREYENLFAAAVARAEADWYVGINATRALTCKHNAQLSCGRVQTPTLQMIAAREEEIRNFVPRVFYGIVAEAGGLKLTWQEAKSKDTRIYDLEECDKVLAKLEGKKAEVLKVDKSRKKSNPPRLYDLTELQREANSRFGYSAKETLKIIQSLYERHKIVTYPRTDSRYLTSDMTDTLKERIKACAVYPYTRLTKKALQGLETNQKKAFVDDSKVSDHHAIIPTEQPVSLGVLDEQERRIFDLIVKRFLAALYPPFVYEQVIVTAAIGGEHFIARGKTVIDQGWKEVYDNSYEDEDGDTEETEGVAEQVLPRVEKGEVLKVSTVSRTEGKTRPPELFNEGTLLSAMENPAKYMAHESRDLIKTIGKTGGLGTVATRADIIEKLFNNFLMEKEGKHIRLTSKGKQLLELVPEELKSPALTAQWEQKLEAISQGLLKKEEYMGEIKDYTKVVVGEIKSTDKKFRHDNITGNKCPQCGRNLLEVKGKKGKMLVCQDRSCGYRKGISKNTNAKCPNCHKKLELRGEGDGQIFVCKCGYREKLSAFQERVSKEKSSVSKRDVDKYLQKQKKGTEEFTNPALAEALAKLKNK